MNEYIKRFTGKDLTYKNIEDYILTRLIAEKHADSEEEHIVIFRDPHGYISKHVFRPDSTPMCNDDYIESQDYLDLIGICPLSSLYFEGDFVNTSDDTKKILYIPERADKTKWVYRLEATDTSNGLWYDSNNNYVFGIGKLKNCATKDLPMGYDERYHKNGKNWFSSCSNKEDLMHWYSLDNAIELIKNGFVFTKYLAKDYVEYEFETTFLKETALAREVIDIEELFKE